MENKSYKEIVKDIEKWEHIREKNQGRSKKQLEGNYKILWWTILIISELIVILCIINLLGWL
jgi:hypothetical protein